MQEKSDDVSKEQNGRSPRWGGTTKLVIAFTIVAIVASLVITFRALLGPLLLSSILVYLLYPIANFFSERLKIPWRLAVSLIYLVLILATVGLLTWGGISLVDQLQSLVRFLEKRIVDLPQMLNQFESQRYSIGPFQFQLGNTELNALGDQLLRMVQSLFSQIGTLLGSFASSAVTTFGWMMFLIVVSYFILAESGGASRRLFGLSIPGYEYDLRRMSMELGRIWNAFLRGQLVIIGLTILVYTALLGILGLRFFFGLAILAGLARFIPYVGPAIAWTTYGLVAFFQGTTLFGLSPLAYGILIIGIAIVVDNIMDNLVVPRLLANVLQVHPAAVMVAALVGATLLGIVGVVLAAPVLATAKLLMNYVTKKLFDQDPWEGIELESQPQPPSRIFLRLQSFLATLRERYRQKRA